MGRCLWLLLVVVATGPLLASEGKPEFRRAGPAAERIERLPRGYAALEPQGAQARDSTAMARQLLVAASRTGDARLAARAESLLQTRSRAALVPEVLALRAFAAQYRHDFDGAAALLDALIQIDPRNGEARLSRAQIRIVQGRLDQARADCAALALGVDAGRGLLCAASLSLRKGNHAAAALLSERWLGQASPADPGQSYALLIRAESASRSGAGDADAWFAKALARGPDDVRTVAAAARHFRRTGRPSIALRVLTRAPASDGIALQRTLAALAAGRPDAPALVAAQQRRYALAHQVGAQPEQRDEAEFLLLALRQPLPALVLAQQNFTVQRDEEDASILVRAAAAAGRPEALDSLRAWSRREGVSLPAARDGR